MILIIFLGARFEHGAIRWYQPGIEHPSVERALNREFHLDKPWYVEYLYYVKGVATFHLGPSLVQQHHSVADIIRERGPVSLTLAGLSLTFALLFGLPLGFLAALRPGSIIDDAVKLLSNAVLALPLFTVAAFSSYFFGVHLARYTHLPSGGYAGLSTWPLPALALGLTPLCYLAQLVRVAMLDALRQDFILAAKARGVRRRRIVALHALRVALLNLLRSATPLLGYFILGIIFTESIFHVDGLGFEYMGALPGRTNDWTVIMGITVLITIVIVGANLLVEIVYAVVGPRIHEAELAPRSFGPDPAQAYRV